MKYLDEYRDPDVARKYCERIRRVTTSPWTIMEVCGGQTHAIVKFGIDDLLPDAVELIHGPGCPVCVTPMEKIDLAHEIALRDGVIMATFGDMVDVPGTRGSLSEAKAQGADVEVVYSPMDALRLAREHPDQQVVFFAVGFETTAPANAMAVHRAAAEGIDNFSVLVSQVLVPPAMKSILNQDENRVEGFLAAGHVCTVTGYEEYRPIAHRHEVPIVVTGFEPLDILQGISMVLHQLEEGRQEVENQYERSVRQEGNRNAMQIMEEVFTVDKQSWRGLGDIPESGLVLSESYREFDAAKRFETSHDPGEDSAKCIAGEVLKGVSKPADCDAFGEECTPEHPLGAPMVSDEGACAAYYRYRKHSS
jgi:hydrogenase expression/formation protein HypD